MMTIALTVLVAFACIHILLHNVFCINTMSWSTSYMIWLYHALLAAGSLWVLLELVDGQSPSIGSRLIILGVAFKYLFERRRNARPVEIRHGRF
jgi:hypothetical protein